MPLRATAFHQIERIAVLTIRIRRLAGAANLQPDCVFSAPLKHSLGVEQWEVGMTMGTVKSFNSGKGFGFVAPEGGGKDVFVHATAVEAAGMAGLAEGQRISFDTQPDAKGQKAVNLKAV
jgi:CspA family cold shock protein